MIRVDDRVLRAFAALEDDPNFEIVVEWLQSRLTATRDATDNQANEVLLRWQQGRAQELKEVLKVAAEARKTLYSTTVTR